MQKKILKLSAATVGVSSMMMMGSASAGCNTCATSCNPCGGGYSVYITKSTHAYKQKRRNHRHHHRANHRHYAGASKRHWHDRHGHTYHLPQYPFIW